MMYRKQQIKGTSITINESVEGESIEWKVNRILNNKEPITDGAPILYSERKDGVIPAYNIRTDRWEVAVEAMDKVSGSYQAKREAKIIEMKKKDSEAETTQGQAGGNQTTE